MAVAYDEDVAVRVGHLKGAMWGAATTSVTWERSACLIAALACIASELSLTLDHLMEFAEADISVAEVLRQFEADGRTF